MGMNENVSKPLDRLSAALALDMEAVNVLIRDRMASRHAPRIPEVTAHLIEAGGKRVRPLLVYAACEALNGDKASADGAACAVELIHAYSLVHDDLPAMDDDDLRRGQPTTHKAFDEACAILAGDGLQSLAFEAMAVSLL